MIDCERHAAERGPGAPVVAAGGCCCCCCCLHSLGAVAGAVYASPHAPLTRRLWWIVTGSFAALIFTFGALNGPWMGGMALGVFLPGGMLAASIVTALTAWLGSEIETHQGLVETLRLTLFSAIGAVIGCLAMAVAWVAMGAV